MMTSDGASQVDPSRTATRSAEKKSGLAAVLKNPSNFFSKYDVKRTQWYDKYRYKVFSTIGEVAREGARKVVLLGVRPELENLATLEEWPAVMRDLHLAFMNRKAPFYDNDEEIITWSNISERRVEVGALEKELTHCMKEEQTFVLVISCADDVRPGTNQIIDTMNRSLGTFRVKAAWATRDEVYKDMCIPGDGWPAVLTPAGVLCTWFAGAVVYYTKRQQIGQHDRVASLLTVPWRAGVLCTGLACAALSYMWRNQRGGQGQLSQPVALSPGLERAESTARRAPSGVLARIFSLGRSKSAALRVTFTNMNGDSQVLDELSPEMTVEELKREVHAKISWAPSWGSSRLLLNDVTLSDDTKTLSSLAVSCESVVTVITAVDKFHDLITACRVGDEDCVLALIQAKANLEETNPEDFTPLMISARHGHMQCTLSLINHEAEVNAQNDQGMTAIMKACQKGHCTVTRALIEHQADVDIQGKRGTALMVACHHRRASCTLALIEASANIHKSTEEGQTALMAACYDGDAPCVRILIQAKADLEKTDHNGVTALMAAAQNHHLMCIQALVQAKASLDVTQTQLWAESMDIALKEALELEDLIAACRSGHEVLARKLLKHQADVNARNSQGVTALMKACQKGHDQCTLALIDHRADLDARSKWGTALMQACHKRHEQCARALIDAGANIDMCNEEGQTALMAACYDGDELCARALIQAKADLESTDNDGVTALTAAAQNRHAQCIKALIEAKASLSVTQTQLWTDSMLEALGLAKAAMEARHGHSATWHSQ